MLPDHVIIRKNLRARRVALRLDHKARVFYLTVPRGMSMRRAEAFAEDQESWMQAQLRALPERVAFADGGVLPIFGRDRVIDVHYDPALKRTAITLSEAHLEVRTNQEDPSGRIKRSLKELARAELSALSAEKAAQIPQDLEASLGRVSIRDTKSRWGSCSADGNLSYSWRLIFAPLDSLDYVVAHEVAHLVHLDHSKNFWAVCRDLSKDFKGGQGWMKDHGAELMRYG